MLSVLQICNHRLGEVHLRPTIDLSAEDMQGRALSCRHQFGIHFLDAEQRTWVARLQMELVHPEEGARSLYTGIVEILGEFEFTGEPSVDRYRLASFNSVAILYGAAREWVSLITARSIHGMVELPTIDARAFLPPEPPKPPVPNNAPTAIGG